MKKYLFVITLFCLLLNTFAIFAQNCDCDALQAEINNLKEQVILAKGYRLKTITPEIIKEYNFISLGDYLIRVISVTYWEIKPNNELHIQLQFLNNSEKTICFDEAINYKFFQNGVERQIINKDEALIYIRPGAGTYITITCKSNNSDGIIELDAFSYDNPDVIFSDVIYVLE